MCQFIPDPFERQRRFEFAASPERDRQVGDDRQATSWPVGGRQAQPVEGVDHLHEALLVGSPVTHYL